MARFDEQIARSRGPCEETVGWLDAIPGVARHPAAMLVAEIGTDLRRFPCAAHLVSWPGLAPGH